jgi:hypothetical protein
VSKLYDRKELIAAAAAFADAIYNGEIPGRPAGETPFHTVCLGERFISNHAVKLLLDPEPSYFGHKEATFAGFAGWVIAPNQPNIRLELIALCICELLAKAEALALEEFGEESLILHDLLARYVYAGPQFLEEIYAAIGGMDQLSELGSRTTADHLFDPEKRNFYTICKMMAACHYVADTTAANETIQPSVNKAVMTVRKFTDSKIVSRASIYSQWAECRETIAWIYAAESIKLQPGTFLEVLLSASASFDEHGNLMAEWAGRAKFFCDHVLRRMPDEDLYQSNLRALRDIPPRRFDCDALSDKEIAFVDAVFSLNREGENTTQRLSK